MLKLHTTLFFSLMALASLGIGLGFDPIKEPAKAQAMYLAPESFLFYRLHLPDGRVQLLEKKFATQGSIAGAGGWSGTVKGDRIIIRAPAEKPNNPTVITFRNGIPIMAVRGNAKRDLRRSWKKPQLPYEESPLFECMADLPPPSDNPDGYWQDGRLTFPYGNPNKSALLYAGIGILVLWLVFIPHMIARITGLLLSAICLGLLFWTASRGGLLAFFFGAGAVGAARFIRFFKRKSVWLSIVAFCVAVAVWFIVAPPQLVTRGSEKDEKGWSNRIRLELWQAAPRMMADAPSGWKISPPGPAYVDWYQPFGKIVYSVTLINDHLTWMASHGWMLRFGYMLVWFVVLSLTGWFAVKTRNAVPFGCWAAIAIAAWFNPVTVGRWSIFVWVPAVVATSAMAMSRTWLQRKSVSVCLLVAMLAASLATACLYSCGKSDSGKIPSIHAEGRRVTIGGVNPNTWVVDDGFALGGLMFGRDIRYFYHKNPYCDPIGYVKSIEDLPSTGIRRLILAGRSGDAFLRKTCSDATGPKGLPPEIIFLSPPFPPQAVPTTIWSRSSVAMYLGEFATWYSPEYADVPSWVKIVPGTVRYFPEWMTYVLGEMPKAASPDQLLR